MALEGYDTFESVKTRLDQIVDAVNNEDLPLDDALALYEEAVALGLRASNMLEENITLHDAEEQAEESEPSLESSEAEITTVTTDLADDTSAEDGSTAATLA